LRADIVYADNVLLRVPSSFENETGQIFAKKFIEAAIELNNIFGLEGLKMEQAERNEKGFLYLAKKDEKSYVTFYPDNGEPKILIRDNRFCYESDDAMQARIMLLKSNMFSAADNAGK